MIKFESVKKLVEYANSRKTKLSAVVIELQAKELGISQEELFEKMRTTFKELKASMKEAEANNKRSLSGLTGQDAKKIFKAIDEDKIFTSPFIAKIIARSIAVAELNACMGKIVAMPTAGACGIVPGTLLTVQEEHDIDEDTIVNALFTAGGIGMVIANIASISGAQGGCQAECGSAGSMAAGAIVEVLGGSNEMVSNACAIAIKSQLGLVCDPVAGLVEVPCIKRNASSAMIAISSAQMAMVGIESVIPVDEVIWAMKNVGDQMSSNLKESAKGGLAITKTGLEIKKKIKK